VSISASIGIACDHVQRDVDETINHLIRKADEKLLKAKSTGRNRNEI
jgi:PleD family two-component response regulator